LSILEVAIKGKHKGKHKDGKLNIGTSEQEPKMIIKRLVEWWEAADEQERIWLEIGDGGQAGDRV